jgi:DNA-binding CsgD family transcriptional regulator
MGVLRQADLRTALDVVAELGEADDVDAFGAGVVAGLRRLIPADAVAYNEIDFRAGNAIVVVDPPQIWFAACVEALARYGSQNPLVAHAIREPHFPALKVSDFVSRREFRRTDIYDCLFRPFGLEHQMACGLPGPQALVVGISINRSSREFSERDRALLDLVRPHLVQAHARAAARELSQATILMLEAALGGVGRAAILLSAGGVIQAASAQALQWLDEYCPAPPSEEMLPEPLAAWQERRREILTKGGARSGDEVLEIRCGSRCLTIRAIGDQEADHDLLVFEERHEVSWHQLRMLGLTPRQAEILQLVAAGRSDREIACLLFVSEHTVGKHLEHIFTRLQVTSRTAAAAVAWQTTH